MSSSTRKRVHPVVNQLKKTVPYQRMLALTGAFNTLKVSSRVLLSIDIQGRPFRKEVLGLEVQTALTSFFSDLLEHSFKVDNARTTEEEVVLTCPGGVAILRFPMIVNHEPYVYAPLLPMYVEKYGLNLHEHETLAILDPQYLGRNAKLLIMEMEQFIGSQVRDSFTRRTRLEISGTAPIPASSTDAEKVQICSILTQPADHLAYGFLTDHTGLSKIYRFYGQGKYLVFKVIK